MRFFPFPSALALLLAASFAGPAASQSIRDQLVALSDGLNDPDPIIRLVTYEEAVRSDDATIRRVALRTALQSSDSDLRTLALRGALKGRDTLSFKLEPSLAYGDALAKAGDSESKLKAARKEFLHHARLLAAYSSTLPIRVTEYDYSSGKIKGACMAALAKPHDKYVFSGTVSGDELTMTTVCSASVYSNCSLSAELEDGGKLIGTLSCPYNAQAVATLDLL